MAQLSISTCPRPRAACVLILAIAHVALAQTSFQGLGDLPGGLGSHATGVSADGSTVVGFDYYVAPGGLLQNHALRWTQAGGLHALFEGGLDYTSSAFAISADGLTIGGWHALTIIEERAFVWTAAGGEHQLATRSGVEALSADGSFAAGYLGQGSGSVGRAVIWDANGHATFIDLPGMSNFASRAFGISADGSIVVGWAPFNGTMVRAFRWTAATSMVNIGSPDPQGPASEAHAITPDGSVIVGTAGTYAFIWRQDRGMEDLQTVLTTPAGWTLTEALGISADGKIVVGSGYPPTGNTQAWIATVPCFSITGDLSAAACSGGTVTLSVTATGPGPFTYQWRFNTTPIDPVANPTAATATLVLTNLSTADAGPYDCIVSKPCQSVISAAATLTVFIGGSGDGNSDGLVNGQDIEGLVSALIDGGPPAAGYCAYDLSANGSVDQTDINLFVDRLLAM